MDWLVPVFIGIGLIAACGFRVFVPLLIMSIAARSGFLHLLPGFEWIGTDAATIAFGIATLLEISGYFIPWLELDTIATPAAILAGILASASLLDDFSPSCAEPWRSSPGAGPPEWFRPQRLPCGGCLRPQPEVWPIRSFLFLKF
jgi:hypothetical protein